MLSPPVAYWDADNDTYYTYVLEDTGVPLVHYLMVNVPGNDMGRGEVVFEYIPSFSLNYKNNDQDFVK